METILLEQYPNMNGLRITPWYDCNMRCSFCYQPTFKSVVLSDENLIAWLDQLKAYRYPIQYITLAGGELALRPERVYQYLKLIRERYPYLKVGITSNGTGSLDFYKKLADFSVDNITLSMNYECNKVKENLEKLTTTSFFTLRINNVMNVDLKESSLFALNFAKKHNLKLTFCEDFSGTGYDDTLTFLQENGFLEEKDDIRETANSLEITTKSGFSFWIWRKDEEQKPSTLFMLPNGTMTAHVDNLLKGKGAEDVF